MKTNTRTQKFTVTVEVKKTDGSGNKISPVTEGEVRRACEKGVDYATSITVAEVKRTPRKARNADALALADLINDYIAAIDEEMEHGAYQTPEFVPAEFEDEEDYYGRHEEITDNVVTLRHKIGQLCKKIRGENKYE